MATKTTELNAVNDMLSAIGEAPVNALSGSLIASVTIARNLIAQETRKLQVKGWHFNQDSDYDLIPNVDGNIVIPDNMIKVDVPYNRYASDYDPVVRGGLLYDKTENTYIWTETIQADVTWVFDFDDIPEVFRQYVMVRAGRLFIDRVVGGADLIVYTQDDERTAWAACREQEAEHADYNIFDNVDMLHTLMR